MPVISTTRYDQAADAMTIAQNLLGDPEGLRWTQTDPSKLAGTGLTDLLPYLEMAYLDLIRELANHGVQLRKSVQIDLPLNISGPQPGVTNTELSDVSTPQLPTDCIVPLKLWEQPTGSGNIFVAMKKVSQLPNFQPGAFLIMWQWQDDQINLIGATQPTTVKIEYELAAPALQSATDPILIPYSSLTLAKGAAYYAGLSVAGNSPNVQKLFEAFTSAMDALVLRYVRPEQFNGRRGRPYGYRRRIIYL